MRKLSIGRDSLNDIVLDHESISPLHLLAAIGTTGEVVIEEPQPTSAGSFVDRQLIKKAAIKPGQVIQIGAIKMPAEHLINQVRDLSRPGINFQGVFNQDVRPRIKLFQQKLGILKSMEDALPKMPLVLSTLTGLIRLSWPTVPPFMLIVLLILVLITFLCQEWLKKQLIAIKESLFDQSEWHIKCPKCHHPLIGRPFKKITETHCCPFCLQTYMYR